MRRERYRILVEPWKKLAQDRAVRRSRQPGAGRSCKKALEQIADAKKEANDLGEAEV